MAAADGRPLIDEQGRLFGAVNVIDALVVCFVVVIVVGGIWFVAVSESEGTDNGDRDGPGPETDVRYATLDVGTVSPQVAAQIEPGDTVQTAHHANLTITDIYRAPAGGTDVGRAPAGEDRRVFVRVELVGLAVDRNGEKRFEYAEEPLRIERELMLETDRYVTTGEIQSVGTSGDALDRTTVQTVLDVTLSATDLDSISIGDQYVVGGEPIGTIESVEAYKTGDPDVRRALIGVEYVTVDQNADVRPVFGTTTIREGATLPFETEQYEFGGTVQRNGTLEPRGAVEIRTVTLELDEVTDRRAEQFSAGMTDQLAGETHAELLSVERSEADTDGKYTVTMTAELRVRETQAGPRFKNEPLRVGNTVTLEFEETSVDATVLSR